MTLGIAVERELGGGSSGEWAVSAKVTVKLALVRWFGRHGK